MLRCTRNLGIVLLALGLLPMLAAMEKKPSAYPPTRKDNVVDKLHGVEVADPYRWLEDGDGKDVQDWVKAQNEYTRSLLDPLPGREKMKERLGTLLDVGTLGTPAPAKER